MSKLYFTSDFHWNHANIIKYCNRPFNNVQEMNEAIINNYNNIIKEEDLCYNLGDVYMRNGKEGGKAHYSEFLNRLNGRYVLINGNHCKRNPVPDVLQSASIFKGGLKWFLVHDPINSKIEYDAVLCGHVHNSFLLAELHEKNKKTLIINCCVDVWDFKPVSFTRLFELYQQWKVGKVKAQIYDRKEIQKFRKKRK